MDFVPFMVLTAVIVVAVAAWGYVRSGAVGAVPRERLPEVEQAFADCLRARGVEPPEFTVYCDPAGGLLIVGPPDLDAATRRALSECDEELSARFGD